MRGKIQMRKVWFKEYASSFNIDKHTIDKPIAMALGTFDGACGLSNVDSTASIFKIL